MEPGSPIKPFTVATALDVGVVTPDTMVSTSPGRITIQRKVIRDVRDYGTIDVSTVVKKSSNIGSAKLALMLEPSELRDRLAMLGFGQSSGLGLSGEADGFLPSFSTWRDLDRAVLSYGYGLMVTPLQLAQAYTVFANDGVLRPVTMLVNGQTPKPVRVFKPETIRQMLPMLQAVTEHGGTAVNARIPLYHVGGKTGTTMKLGDDGGYASKRYISSFVGIAPMDRPRFVMAVVIDDPQAQQYYGGQVAAPVFADVMDDVMRLYDVPPDNPADALLAGGRP
jgi:cell division protein FtsI (penicillin-binding protein 3)